MLRPALQSVGAGAITVGGPASRLIPPAVTHVQRQRFRLSLGGQSSARARAMSSASSGFW
jgi:hypothetical protein